jgi:pimeloyl-ACP methyl ester carboxylesterase
MNSLVSTQRIQTRDVGTQNPALIFVHGFACGLGDYDAQLEALSPTSRCIALDLPGHGDSAMPPGFTIGALASAVNEVKKASGAERVILVGHSMGSKVIREAYRQSPAKVSGLVFLDGSTYVGDPEVQIERVRTQINSLGYTAFLQRLFAQMLFEGSNAALRESLISRARQVNPEFAMALLIDAIRWEASVGEPAMKQIEVPVLVLQSTAFSSDYGRISLTQDMTTPFMEAVTRAVKQAEVKVITGVGHLPMIEVPAVVNRLIREFVTRMS